MERSDLPAKRVNREDFNEQVRVFVWFHSTHRGRLAVLKGVSSLLVLSGTCLKLDFVSKAQHKC